MRGSAAAEVRAGRSAELADSLDSQAISPTPFVRLGPRRAAKLDALAPYKVHGQPAGAITKRPWGERSFYVVDRWGNGVCFVEDGTLYT
jgi:hypothetical protein